MVSAGDPVAVLEAMKMEMHVVAPFSGRIRQVMTIPYVQVATGSSARPDGASHRKLVPADDRTRDVWRVADFEWQREAVDSHCFEQTGRAPTADAWASTWTRRAPHVLWQEWSQSCDCTRRSATKSESAKTRS